jgi:methionine-S-sulfoxide reductase
MMRAVLLTAAGIAVGISGFFLIARAQSDRETTPAPRPSTTAHASATAKHAAKPAAKPAADTSAKKKPKRETAVFAGGCFWCTEFAFEQLAGVLDVESGYCGGSRNTANYEDVHLGGTHHAEAIRVTYDPAKISYDDLLKVFFDAHDPTQLNKQGADVGRQYRSAIFFASDEQKEKAEAKIEDLESRHVYRRRIVTKLEPLKEFYPAENVHQDFARRNPYNPYIEGHAFPRAIEVRTKHRDLIAPPTPPRNTAPPVDPREE